MTEAAEKRDWASRRFHFVGIGGAGMSGLAFVCHELGAGVTGSDRADSSYMEGLRAAGLEPVVGHDAVNVPERAEVVVSTAIGGDNPELAAANERGLSVLRRGELLAELCREKRLIAVAGAHGKTTTTAMVAWALRALGADPAFFIGGEVPGLGLEGGAAANAGWGGGEWVVAEADESDASFLKLSPEIAVVTNIEMDHHSRWGSVAELRRAFRTFVEPAGAIALPAGEAGPGAPRARGSAGWDSAAALREELAGDEATRILGFDADSPGPPALHLGVPGHHNLLNARAALAALQLAGEDVAVGAASLREFPGVRRRLELKAELDGVRVYDDYAHHPTAVRAALETLRETGPKRLIAVFQPHLYSRTKALAEELGAALALADEVVVLDVYPAREEPVGELAGVSGKLVADAASDRMGGRPVSWAPTIEQARRAVQRRLAPGCVVVTIGAGDVCRLGEDLAAAEGAR